MNKFLLGLAGFGAALLAGAIYLQQTATAELRTEIAALRADVQHLAKNAARVPRSPDAAVTASVAPQDAAASDEARAELAKLREEIRGLKSSTQELTQIAKAANAGAGKPADPFAGVPVNITPVGALKNAGKATPSQATESILWAATGGDVDALAEHLMIEPKAKQKADDWFATLPEATRAQYGSPEKVIALMVAKDAAALTGMQVVGAQQIKPDISAVRVRMQADNGQTKDETLAFYHAPDGWRMILPENVVQKFANRVSGGGK